MSSCFILLKYLRGTRTPLVHFPPPRAAAAKTQLLSADRSASPVRTPFYWLRNEFLYNEYIIILLLYKFIFYFNQVPARFHGTPHPLATALPSTAKTQQLFIGLYYF
jgi:hypothetical protein